MIKGDLTTPFNLNVAVAYFLLRQIFQELGQRLADVWVYRYVNVCAEEEREDFLGQLIYCSYEVEDAWIAAKLLVLDHLQAKLPLPPELAYWYSQTLKGTLPQPKTTGKDANTHFVRDLGIVVVAPVFIEEGGLKGTRNGDGPSECCDEGGSACDVVGKALAALEDKCSEEWKSSSDGESEEVVKEDKKPRPKVLTYKGVEGIWTESTSPDSFRYRYGPSRRPVIEQPRFCLSKPRKTAARRGPSKKVGAQTSINPAILELLRHLWNDIE